MMTEETDVANVKETIVSCDEKASTVLPSALNVLPIRALTRSRIVSLPLGSYGSPLRADGRTVDGSPLGIAVAINGAVIRRAQWAATPVRGVIDVVTAGQGG
jgi:sulfur carrier protein